MSQLFNYSGQRNVYLGRLMYANGDALLPCKRARLNPQITASNENRIQANQTSLDGLPDECLFEIFRRLEGGKERHACAFVSKRWLSLLSGIHVNEMRKDDDAPEEAEDGFLTRSLEGKEATDMRLAAIAFGTGCRGGLGELFICGSNPTRGVTNFGLRAISRCCRYLKRLSLWNVRTIDDQGLIEIADGCKQLERLDLYHCPTITDNALAAIAIGCPRLSSLNIDSFQNIGNPGLEAVGKLCHNLNSVLIKDCPNVGNEGIMALVSSASSTLSKLKLHGLKISDMAVAFIGYHGRLLTDLVLSSLPNVTEKGFWCMGSANGLKRLRTLSVNSCRLTDLGIEAISKGCRNLKTIGLHRLAFISDNGLVSFSKAVNTLETVRLDECHRITQLGFFGLLLNSGRKLKSVSVYSCIGIRDMPVGATLPKPAHSLHSLTIHNCPYFGDVNLALLSTGFCFELNSLELSGLLGISDYGATLLIESSDAGLESAILSGSSNLTDKTVSALTKAHGGTLEVIKLKGCGKITDESLVSIADDCLLLDELDVTRCAITDAGVMALSQSNQFVGLIRILSMVGCGLLSDKCLPSLVKLGSGLRGLNLLSCNGISRRTLDMLEEGLGNCDILS